jgi:hypothetical protein
LGPRFARGGATCAFEGVGRVFARTQFAIVGRMLRSGFRNSERGFSEQFLWG